MIGTVLGVVAARRPNGATSHAVTLLALFGYSAPVFWTGIMLIILFCSIFPIFPVGGMIDVRVEGSWFVRGLDVLHHLMLPMVTLASIFLALYSRLARASMLDVLGSDYVRTARAKGLSEFVVVYKHALRNALGPVVTLAGLQFSGIMSGAVLVETVFSWPGLGSLALQSILARDTPTILGILFFSSSWWWSRTCDGSRLQPGRSPHRAGGTELTVAADAASVRDTPATLGNLFFPSIAVVVANWPADLDGDVGGVLTRSAVVVANWPADLDDSRAGPGGRN